jgi:hypothetical protein
VSADTDSERTILVFGAGGFVARQHRFGHYAKRAGAAAEGVVSAAALWRMSVNIGGENRIYYADALWSIREWIDAAFGGPGRERMRLEHAPAAGDRIDSWRVIGSEPERRLTLGFRMKAPRAGVPEFEIEPLDAGRNRVRATAYWHPAGLAGLLLLVRDGARTRLSVRRQGARYRAARVGAGPGIHRSVIGYA